MSFTTVEIVKKHLMENHIVVSQIDSEPAKISDNSIAQLRYPPVNNLSEKVKAKEQIKPDYQVIAFPPSNQVNLSKSQLIRDTVVVASDSSLGQIYKENLDYTVDFDSGVLTRISSGNLPAGVNVSVWYLPYRVYKKGVDYNIDYTKGELSRIGSGDIEAGQWLYVDYISEYAFIEDDTIVNAINEANEQVLNYIDTVYSSSSDRSLVVAETYLAIAVICRIKALWAVSSGLKNFVSSTWSALANQYKRDAFMFLEKFTGSLSGFKSPAKA
ncbi:MAG: hypothetical protein GY839_11665 [candidate division Zixibacteria bacterium]|nr:hypothetical protein [candidate division Zixibacteria bacterium]